MNQQYIIEAEKEISEGRNNCEVHCCKTGCGR